MVLKIEVIGRTGKMGSAIVRALLNDPECEESSPPDVVIDVSCPEAFKSRNLPMVIGSTGHPASFFQQLEKLAESVPVMYAPNFSFGITLLKALALNVKTCVDAKIDITEVHHDEKIDSPSGTALHLANLLETTAINSYRRPHATGEHRIYFSWGDEELEIRHKARSRAPYADGAIKAAKWIINQPPGLYGMEDLCKM